MNMRLLLADGKNLKLNLTMLIMDIYAKVKYNKPEELFSVVNGAFHQNAAD